MKKADILDGLVSALENSSTGNTTAYLCGWFSKKFDEGDKDAKRIIEAIAKKDPHVAKYLAKHTAERGPLLGSEL